MDTLSTILQHVWNGLSLGSIYALIALGYTMVYGVLKLINFAHGEIFMMGAFASYFAVRLALGPTGGGAGRLVLALAAAMIACSALAVCIEQGAYRPLRTSPRLNSLITAIGVSLLLQNLGQNLFGADPKGYPEILAPRTYTLLATAGSPGLSVTRTSLVVLAVSVLLMAGLQWIIFRTKVGTAMRAVSENQEIAGLMGIPTNKVITFTFVLGAALAGAAGVLYGISYPQVDPIMGLIPGIKAFVAAVLGGIGSVPGAMVGGITIGLAEEAVVGLGFSTWRDAMAFGILIVILLVRPTGLFGRVEPEKV